MCQDVPRIKLYATPNQGAVAWVAFSQDRLDEGGRTRLMREIENLDGAQVIKNLEVVSDLETRQVVFAIGGLNPYAESHTASHMLLLQHFGKRAVYLAFPLDLTSYGEVKKKCAR